MGFISWAAASWTYKLFRLGSGSTARPDRSRDNHIKPKHGPASLPPLSPHRTQLLPPTADTILSASLLHSGANSQFFFFWANHEGTDLHDSYHTSQTHTPLPLLHYMLCYDMLSLITCPALSLVANLCVCVSMFCVYKCNPVDWQQAVNASTVSDEVALFFVAAIAINWCQYIFMHGTSIRCDKCLLLHLGTRFYTTFA